MTYTMTAPCHFGLEKTLSFEISRAGGENISCTDGRVTFTGDDGVLIKANMSCASAERIGIVLAEFTAKSFDDVFDNVKSIPIFNYVGQDDQFPIVKGQSVNSVLTSIPALQRTIKKAFVITMSEHYKVKTFAESGKLFPIRFFLFKDKMTIFLDTSGEGLHKRGYRAVSNAAPIKETLAAGLIDLAKVRGSDVIIDPFCGSGTILIEAAFKALNIPPCLNRRFTAMDWGLIPKALWTEKKDELKANIKTDSDFLAYGFDIDPACVTLTMDNAKKAGVGKYIQAEKRAVKDFKYPDNPVKMKIITNPPYAERLLTKEEAVQIYKEMGRSLLPRGNNELYVIVENEEFEKHFGEKADKNRKLYNGMIMCRYFMYNKN